MSLYEPVLEVLLKTSVLLSVGLLMGIALNRVSSSRRHFLYGATVVAALALAPITIAAPGWVSLELPVGRPAFRLTDPVGEPDLLWWDGVGAPEAGESIPGVPLPPSTTEAASIGSIGSGASLATIVGLVAAVAYLSGVTLLLCLLGRSLLLLRKLARRGVAIPQEDWRRRVLHQLLGTDGRQAVGLAETDRCSVPFVWGWRAPSILLPTHSRYWPAARLKSVLIHELAHVGQRDVFLRLAAELLCALQWMNPLTWAVARRLRTEGEAACDDAVLAAGVAPTDYAGELLGLGIERRWHLRIAGAMSGGSPLGRRIEAVLDGRLARSSVTHGQRWGIAVSLTLSCAVLVAADWQEGRLAPPARGPTALGAPAVAPGTVATVPVQLRWNSGSESGAAFLGGAVDLEDDERGRVGEPGFFLLFHRGADGSIRSARAVTDAVGSIQRTVRSDDRLAAWNGNEPTWIARDLPLVGLKLRALGDRVIWRGSPLSTYVDDSSVPRASGSVMTGLPAITESGSRGSLVAGWQTGADRVGLLACGAPGVGMDAEGARALLRQAIDRGGRIAGLAEGECLIAFAWNADRAELRLFESYRAFGGTQRTHFTDGSRTLSSANAEDWLLALLSSGTTQMELE